MRYEMKKIIPVLSILLTILTTLFISCANSPQDSNLRHSPYFSESQDLSRSSDAQNDNRLISYSASLDLSVKNKEETKNLLIEQIKINEGFIIRESDTSITSRIPSENMDNFLNYSRTLGKVENESKTGTDITDQYRDNLLRLENLKTVRLRYITLLDRANTVTDILAIEKELERVNLEIERLEGRIQYAEQSTAYSSITVRFNEKPRPGPVGWVFVGLYHGVRWLFVWD